MKKKASKSKKPFAIIANKSYGLYAGIVESFDTKNGVAVVSQCRHVAQWYGKTGGITSLAAHGLCGPRAARDPHRSAGHQGNADRHHQHF